MKHSLKTICALLALSGVLGISTSASALPLEALKKSGKAKTAKAAPSKAVEAEEPEPEIQHDKNTDYKCELGANITTYAHPSDDNTIAMRWKNRLYKLTKVETSTGANRFENEKAGLVWIDIPAKALLLDSRRGQQLANECKANRPTMTAELDNKSNTQTK
ncbi:hypothetical protein RF679_09805 [Undibacterium cyanobacteriorum]|uniref:C-type lysozyme inhibitor domain-containing protein n=1 Tax=Undibacterium cyanobacteriorum TaxID=3073561 RepID=A0ABY9RDL5_9BURK|nr:hypothetical protein [Undibacterium sp. 20NA77.5]WMW78958.1 hypothetical protein RF679_09805 [Undibacterium sp. 20NA77.5]